MNFDQAITYLFKNEGGTVNNPNDPGGLTRWGISQRSYPNVDIRNLTQAQAADIYRRDFWVKCSCDQLPAALRFEVFDMAVNSGVTTAIKTLQAALGVTTDGVLGPKTIAAAARADAIDSGAMLRKMQARRLLYYTNLSTFATFGRGWVNRIAANMLI